MPLNKLRVNEQARYLFEISLVQSNRFGVFFFFFFLVGATSSSDEDPKRSETLVAGKDFGASADFACWFFFDCFFFDDLWGGEPSGTVELAATTASVSASASGSDSG